MQPKNLIKWMCSAAKSPIITSVSGKNFVDLSLLDTGLGEVDTVVVVNNKLNIGWL